MSDDLLYLIRILLGSIMHQETITFQLANHYVPQIATRLERLFIAIAQASEESHPIIHHYALKNIIEIIKIIEKPELKSRFIKELMRLEHVLKPLPLSLSNTQYASLFVQIQVLTHMAGKFGDNIQHHPFLQSVRMAQTAHLNDSDQQAPQLVWWLSQETQQRQHDLLQWFRQLKILHETVTLYLTLLRDTVTFKSIDMIQGFYHQPISSKTNCQLILLRMPTALRLVPKIQLGHHGLSLRLCDAVTMQETRHTNASVELAICQV